MATATKQVDEGVVASGLRELTERGISNIWAQQLIAFGAAHRKPFADGNLRAMINDLYDELGPASFTVTWQHDPRGLLNAAVAFLADLRLLRRVEAGVLVLPAAARYRNIKAALPVRHAEGQLALDLFGGDINGDINGDISGDIGGESDDD